MKKKVTMKEIAQQIGVSINAVSLALNDRAGVSEETRHKVLNIAEQMGYLDQKTKYVPAYSSKTICVLLKQYYFNDMHFYGRVLLGLEESAREFGYDVLINSFEESQKIPTCIENRKVCGIIVVGKIKDNYLLQLKSYSIPVVLVDHTSLLESTDSILTDNKLGTFKATKYLIDKGFRKIGFFGGLEYSLSINERYWGYKEALRMFLEFHSYLDVQEYIRKYSLLEHIEEHIIKNEEKAIKEKLSLLNELPQAFVCSNDRAAILLCKSLTALDIKVPEHISVFGFDDIALSAMVMPQITTIHVYKELMGKKAMERMKNRLEHPNAKIEKTIMDVKIIERESIGLPQT